MASKFQDKFAFKLTEQQSDALDFIDEFLTKREYKGRPFIRVGGLAGTGKTSVIANAFKDQCKIAAPTWVAAKRLSQELGISVDTYHRVFLIPTRANKTAYDEEREEIIQKFREQAANMKVSNAAELRRLRELRERQLRTLDKNYPLGFQSRGSTEDDICRGVIIDESSMITEEHAEHIMSQGVPVVFIGDHGQLPPVQGKPFFTGYGLDFELDQIVRQKDAGLLKLLHQLRNSDVVPRQTESDNYSIRPGEVEDYITTFKPGEVAVIAFKAADVRRFNDMFSEHTIPEPGDLIRVYKQYSDRYQGVRRVFRNGYVYEVELVDADGTYSLTDVDSGRIYHKVNINTDLFYCDRIDAAISPDTHQPFNDEIDGMRCDFVYSMTGHKSQGSQWPHVIVYAARPGRISSAGWRRWLYTAASRATEYLTIIDPGAGRFDRR